MEAGSIAGRWTVLERDRYHPYHSLCVCSCGNIKSVRNSSLRNQKSSSCGCFRKQAPSNRKTHGKTDSAVYRSWQQMLARVKSDRHYKNIKVCDRWQEFEHFYLDLGDRPEGKNVSLGRIDNLGDYEPNNCRWENPSEQNRNKGTTCSSPQKDLELER